MNILKINSSVQTDKSVSRQLVDQVINKLSDANASIVNRDLSDGVPLLSQAMVNAFYTPADKLSPEQKELIQVSDELVAELQAADTIVIGAPIYNFSVPGALKAYFDLVARVGVTFKYTDNGPLGLLEGKKAIVVVASGGTGFQSEADYASNYTKQFLGFIGIKDVEFVAADQLMFGAEAVLERANARVDEIAQAFAVAA